MISQPHLTGLDLRNGYTLLEPGVLLLVRLEASSDHMQ